MIRVLSRLQWLAIIGFVGIYYDNKYIRLFFLFWLFSLLDCYSPMRSLSNNLKFLLQNLVMLFGIPLTYIRYGFRLPTAKSYPPKTLYSLPFSGKWLIVNGGTDRQTSHSWILCSQRYAYDFFITDDEGQSFCGDRNELSSYLCYQKDVLAPADGIVIKVVDCFENTPIVGIGMADCAASDVRGNYIIIKHSKYEYSTIAHLMVDSICVKVGDIVYPGQRIAKCGNSGNTSEPHIHFQLQSCKSFSLSAGLPICFQNIKIDHIQHNTAYITKGHYVENV